jgi:hypothetical protein
LTHFGADGVVLSSTDLREYCRNIFDNAGDELEALSMWGEGIPEDVEKTILQDPALDVEAARSRGKRNEIDLAISPVMRWENDLIGHPHGGRTTVHEVEAHDSDMSRCAAFPST